MHERWHDAVRPRFGLWIRTLVAREMLAPAGTPAAVLETLHRAIADALKQPNVAAFLANDGTEAVGSSPHDFAGHLKVEREKWAKVIKQAGVQAE
jgi:tripartite-type tricarboxylate transporter receptor subunit TctC